MKYRFIAAVHNLLLEKADAEICLKQGTISNSGRILMETLDNDLSIGTLGVHSVDEIRESVFYFCDGTFPEDCTPEKIDEYGTSLTFAFLRVIQHFVADLWTIRDNSIYVRDGFLYVYKENLEDGVTFKASVSSVISKADGSFEKECFTSEEILSLNDGMFTLNPEEIRGILRMNYKQATQDFIRKQAQVSRKELAYLYVQLARSMALVAIKLMYYSIALEALVGTAQTEISHRMAERVVALIGEGTAEDKAAMYSMMKRAYDVRSTVAHGDLTKSDTAELAARSVYVDGCLRKMMRLDEPYSWSDERINDFFVKNLFR